ncbi:DNA ligase 1-like [Senna tora]|uniref:DNA ligase 1-like n=1 Tax=Senna tora TaxID=362788 RepID=A0A835CJI1_9FABA|nr:DNA ligase 1-like [Senna tora]
MRCSGGHRLKEIKMKTISGQPISTKPISFSKAAKILNKFVSADNGASHVVNVYLNRASTAFDELKQLHKEINSPHSDQKHKRDRSETRDHSVEQNQGAEQLKTKFRKHQDAIEEHAEKDGGNEKHKKKRKKHDDELQVQDNGVEGREGECKPLTKAVNEDEENVVEKEKRRKKKKQEDESKKHGINGTVEIEEGSSKGKIFKAQEQGDALDDIKGMDEGKKHKKEKKEKNKKEDKDYDGVKTAQKKRKNEDVEGEVEDRSSQLKKKIKRKHGGDS